MTPKEQQVAIALHLGWKDLEWKLLYPPLLYGVPPNGVLSDGTRKVPDFQNDLNAMHEAVQIYCRANPLFLIAYHAMLMKVANTQFPLEAPADKRAEAFLRTIDKWKDDE